MSSEEELFESAEEDGDFSASEDEWLPTNEKPEDETIDDSVSEDEDELDGDEDEDEDSTPKTRSGKKRKSNGQPSQRKKVKKFNFATAHRQLDQKKKRTPAESSVEIPSTLSNILKKSAFKAKKLSASQSSSKDTAPDSDSDSSGDDYLVNPDQLDLNSDFFKSKPAAEGVQRFSKLEDSDSEDEPVSGKSVTAKINKDSAKAVDMQDVYKRNLEFEKTKARMQQLRDKDATKNDDFNVSQLLKMGEPEQDDDRRIKTVKKRRVERDSDWESVDEEEQKPKSSGEQKDLQITVQLPGHIKRSKDKKEVDIEAQIKRKLNRVKKENQVYMHKVNVLGWIAHGNLVNKMLNNLNLYKACLKALPGDRKQCYPKNKTDIAYYERIATWFKSNFKIRELTMYTSMKSLPPLATSLALQIQEKTALCKRDFVFIFVILMRAMGFQCRLIINLHTVPIRPPQSELCKISVKAKLHENYKPEVQNETGEKTSLEEIKRKKPEPKVGQKIDQLDGGSDNFKRKQINSPDNSRPSKAKANRIGIELIEGEPSPRRTRNQRSRLSNGEDLRKNVLNKFTKPEKKSIKLDTSPKPSTSTAKPKPKPILKPSTSKVQQKTPPVSKKRKRVHIAGDDSDDDFTPPTKIKSPQAKPVKKQSQKIDRRCISTDTEEENSGKKQPNKRLMNFWVEVYAETEKRWVTIDLFKPAVDCVDQLCRGSSSPMAYVLAWNNDNTLKDVSPRYCEHWNTTTRTLRVEQEWLDKTLRSFRGRPTARDKAEDKYFNKIHSAKPLPTVVSEFKNHPLYALERHLLKFEAIYPADAPPIGWFRKEPVYARDCVYTLHTREKWVKEARVVKLNEEPYKIVNARPKWDKSSQTVIKGLLLEIFGIWQTKPYEPPTAENGIVPRNAYGNVELFKECMLPKKTVHLRLPSLNKVCKKLGIDCAPAVVGFDFHSGSSHPVYDGFVVCEEFAETCTDAWCQEQDELDRKEVEKREKRIYDNWRKLIRGVLIRARLQAKYNFQVPEKKAKKN